MRIRTQLACIIFATGSLGVAALVADRYASSREILYGRAQERASGILEAVESLAMPRLLDGNSAPVAREIGIIGKLPRVAYIRIHDPKGKVVLRAGPKAAAIEINSQGPRLIEMHKATMDSVSGKLLGGIQIAVSTENIAESLQTMIWRGLAIGALAVMVLAVAAWYLGIFLGRRFESLTAAVERVGEDQPLKINSVPQSYTPS